MSVSARVLDAAKPFVVTDDRAIYGIVEGHRDLAGVRYWILRSPRGNLRARIEVPEAADAKLAANVGLFVCVAKQGEDYYVSHVARMAANERRMDVTDDPSGNVRGKYAPVADRDALPKRSARSGR